MIKKIIFGLVVLVIVTTTGASCNCMTGKNKNKLPQVNLTIWGPLDGADVFNPIIDRYILAKQNEANIKITYVKKDYAEYEQTSLDALASGSGPDIWVIRNNMVYKHADKLVVMPKGLFKKSSKDARTDIEIYQDTFSDIAVDDNIINNQILGLPFSIDTLVVYYNLKQFTDTHDALYKEGKKDEAKLFVFPPNNWEEFLKMSEILTQKDANGNIVRAGAAMGQTTNVEQSTDILAALMIQNSTKMVSADNLTATFNLPITKETGESSYPGTQALNFYTSFTDPAKENYMWNASMPNSTDAFMQEKVSMMINYGYIRKRIEQEAPTLKYGVGPFPQIAGATTSADFANYWTNTVTNSSKQPNEAWKFIKYVYENKLDSYLAATQRPSSKKINSMLVPQTKERAKSQEDPFKYQIMTAKYWYEGKYPVKVANAFYQMIEDVVITHEPLQKSIDKAAATVTEIYKLSAPGYQPVTSGSTTTSSPTPTPTTTSTAKKK